MATPTAPRPASPAFHSVLDQNTSSDDGGSNASGTGQIIVFKVGTSSLVDPSEHRFNLSALARLAETVRTLHDAGHYPIIVTSGAVGVGCHRLGLQDRPVNLAQRQALAAIGQGHLMKFYEDFFTTVGLTCAQVLVTLDNLAVRGQYVNVRNTFTELLGYGVIPIVNENDCISVAKLKFGDNDTLAAHVAALVQANWLFLMTDVDHLYTSNPKTNPDASPIYEVHDMVDLDADTSTKGTQWGTGGMATKLTAARIATAAGVTMVILNANQPEAICDVIGGADKIGTTFFPMKCAVMGRKRWILSVPVTGQVHVDVSAMEAVVQDEEAISFSQVLHVEGEFCAQDAVQLCDPDGAEFARCLVNVPASELHDILRTKAWEDPEFELDDVINKDNIALLNVPGEVDSAAPSTCLCQAPSGADSAQNVLRTETPPLADAPAMSAVDETGEEHAADAVELLAVGADDEPIQIEFLETMATDDDAVRLQQKMCEMAAAAVAAPDLGSMHDEVHHAQEQHALDLCDITGVTHHLGTAAAACDASAQQCEPAHTTASFEAPPMPSPMPRARSAGRRSLGRRSGGPHLPPRERVAVAGA